MSSYFVHYVRKCSSVSTVPCLAMGAQSVFLGQPSLSVPSHHYSHLSLSLSPLSPLYLFSISLSFAPYLSLPLSLFSLFHSLFCLSFSLSPVSCPLSISLSLSLLPSLDT